MDIIGIGLLIAGAVTNLKGLLIASISCCGLGFLVALLNFAFNFDKKGKAISNCLEIIITVTAVVIGIIFLAK